MAAKKANFTPRSARRIAAAVLQVEATGNDARGRRRRRNHRDRGSWKNFAIRYVDRANGKVWLNDGWIVLATDSYYMDGLADEMWELSLADGGTAAAPLYVGLGIPYADITGVNFLSVSATYPVSNNTQSKIALFSYYKDATASPKVLTIHRIHHEGDVHVNAFRLGAVS